MEEDLTRTRVECVRKMRYDAACLTFDTMSSSANNVFADAALVPDFSTPGVFHLLPPPQKTTHTNTHTCAAQAMVEYSPQSGAAFTNMPYLGGYHWHALALYSSHLESRFHSPPYSGESYHFGGFTHSRLLHSSENHNSGTRLR